MRPGCLALAILSVAFLLPFFYAHIMVAAMAKLGIPPGLSLWVIFGVIIGGLINLPLARLPREEEVDVDHLSMFGLDRLVPQAVRRGRYTLIAVNVGGCLIPVAIVVLQIMRLVDAGAVPLIGTAGVTLVNILVCYHFARPVKRVGITMPTFLPPLVAASGALLLVPEWAPQAAFVAGILGPVVGADLLHLKEIGRIATGVASIGGAGTFDGIVLSGVIATVLA